MKRLALFLLFASIGTFALVHFGGGFTGDAPTTSSGDLPESDRPAGARPVIETPDGQLDIERASNITQMAPPMRIVWKDRVSDETIVIDNFQPWRCTAHEVHPLPIAETGGQGALLTDVVWDQYRDPKSRTEALALRDGTGEERYQTLLHQRFRAGSARVSGKLGEAMAARRSGNAAERGLGDTKLVLSEDIVIEDKGQGLVIRGGEGATLTVYPEQDRATGSGPFTLEHEAVHLTGNGLDLVRNAERGYIRVEILRNPRLHIERVAQSTKGGPSKTVFDFGKGDFQPTTVTSEGTAVLEREMLRRETVLTVVFEERVHAAQVGGRTLTAGRATLIAERPETPQREDAGWKLRSFHGDKGVTIRYPGKTKEGESYLATISAKRLRYDVPVDGTEPTTVLEEDVDIRMRGQIALLGPDGFLRASCRDRAWIGPLPADAPDGGVARELLRQIALRGAARLERTTLAAGEAEDRIRANAIDLVVWPRERDPNKAPTPSDGGPERSTRMTAVHFAALGDVRVESAQIQGDTGRIIADDLHTVRPRVYAEGEGTRFTFQRLARNQGLLGPAVDQPGPDAPGKPATEEDGRWTLSRIIARGAVDIDTSLGGPAVGIPAHLQGDVITYDGISRIARVRSLGGEPVRIAWSAAGSKTNHIETTELTLDRAAGRLTAEGGVIGELYVARGGGANPFRMSGPTGAGSNLDGAALTVSTNKRIDLTLTRLEGTTSPKPGVEQLIRITGPVTTELRTSSRLVDRMQSDSLEVALSYQTREDTFDDPATAPTSRAGRRDDTSGAGPRQEAPQKLERIDIAAKSVRVDMSVGEARYLTADGGVDLKGLDGHVTGERLTYDGERERIEVHAGSRAPARALLGTKGQRSEIQAQRMVVGMRDGKVARIEAHAPPRGTSDIHLYRTPPKKPGQTEWFALTYQGSVVMLDSQLTTQRVRLIRRMRKAGEAHYGQAVVLRTPKMIVKGRRMLATDEGERHVATIEALEHGTGPGSEVNILYGQGTDKTELWGHRFVVFVPRQRARLEGRRGQDLRIRRGGRLTMDQTSVELDLTTNLPTFIPGSRIHWKPARK